MRISMKMKLNPFLSMIALIILASSCSLTGLNVKKKTPLNPGKYPVFTEADTLRGKNSEYRSGYDVTFYRITIDVNIDDKYIRGHVDIYFTALNDLDTIQIDLYRNMTVNNVMYQSDMLDFQRKYDAIFAAFRETVKQGTHGVLTVYYEGKPVKARKPPWEGGFVWKRDKNKNPWVGVSCELDGASLWWPLKDHLSDEPDSLEMNVAVPEGLFCVSNGRLTAHKKENNQEVFTWKTSYPINSYNATVYIGDYSHFTLTYPAKDTTYNLDFFVLPYHLDVAREHFKQAIGILRFYEDTFGEYPWWRDGYKLVESPYAGMEHQTAIAYGSDYKNCYGAGFDYIILHETAHEWWGNSVSAGDYAEIWLHEGFATYSEALYVEHTKGHDAYLNYLGFYSMMIENKRPLIGPYDVNYWDYKDGDVYVKGALLLHTLRNAIGNDTTFFDIIKTFYNRYKYSITTTKNFIDLVAEKTGKDYQWLFDQYLYDRACPQLEWNYQYDYSIGSYEMRYRWKNVRDDFTLPVLLQTESGTYVLHPSGKMQKLSLLSGGTFRFNGNKSYVSFKQNIKL